MRLESHRQIPNDPRLRPAWNALVGKMERPEVFYTWEWSKAVEFAYSSSLPPWLILAFDGDALVGVAALTLNGEKRAAFLAGTTADYCDFLSEPARRAEFLDGIFVELQAAGCRRLELANLPKDSTTTSFLEAAARRHNFRVFARPAYECAQVNLGGDEQRQQMKAHLARKKSFRRNMNALGHEGVVRLSHLTTWQEIEPILPRFARAHVGRFLSTGRHSNLVRADRRAFLHELARRLCDSHAIDLTRLMVGDRPIAWNYGFRFRGSWFWYQPTFDSRLEEFSPGNNLLASMIIEACDTPELSLVDLGLGAEGYKERYANGSRPTLHVTITRSRAEAMREALRFRAAERIKRSPTLEASIRSKLERFASIGRRAREKPAHFLSWATNAAVRSVASSVEVRFYEWPAAAPQPAAAEKPCALHPIDYDLLGQTAITYEHEGETLTYLLRAAERLKRAMSEGFALLDPDGRPVHLCWAGAFAGFEMAELQTRLDAPSPSASMIFDCWTPQAARGRGFYATAIALLAERLRQQGRTPWIFSAATNVPSIHGIESAGFVYRYSMIRRKMLARRARITAPATNS